MTGPARDADARGTVFDVQRFSIHDGPGIRTTVFLKGCPLTCPWCQNPESTRPEPQLMLYRDLCIGCGGCTSVCPELADHQQPAAPIPDGDLPRPATCTVCGRCVDACPTEARRIAGRVMSAGEVADLALRDRPFYRGGGGVTLGGGEPLAQWDFARAVAALVRAAGVHVALDTACVGPTEAIQAVPDCFDLVLADLKFVTPATHLRWTGVDGAGALQAVRRWAAAMPGRLWVSVPLVPGVHDPAEIARIADFVACLAPVPPVRLLPYHRLGESKYRALGRPAPAFPGRADDLVAAATAALAARGVEILRQ